MNFFALYLEVMYKENKINNASYMSILKNKFKDQLLRINENRGSFHINSFYLIKTNGTRGIIYFWHYIYTFFLMKYFATYNFFFVI